jgi:hypothetical protein
MKTLHYILGVFLFLTAIAFSAEGELKDRWVYIQTNLQANSATDDLEKIMRRAAAAGYNGIQLNDTKLSKLDDLGGMEKVYYKNVERIKNLAKELKLELIPGLFSIGYSNDVLWHNPNLAEGLAVIDAPFEVKDGIARIVPDERDFKKINFKDDNVTVEDGVWKMKAAGGMARINFKFKVQPHREYHISVKIKTDEFKSQPEIKILAGNRSLAFAHLGVKPTQDWTEHHQVFNSQEFIDVAVYFGSWSAKSGTIQWKDAKLEEIGLMNALRRDGCPLKVVNEKGEVLEEGKDFEKFSDPLMGSKPWKGSYDVYHQPPPLKTKLPDGAKLKVSYYHVMTVYDGQVMLCPSEPQVLELLKKQAKLVHEAFGASKYFMHFDEIRCMNQCAACQKRNMPPGAMIAEMARQCTKILHDTAPGAMLYTWNDMFDPFHNAVTKDYYLVNGDLTGSWEGLEKETVIVEWHFGKREQSMDFFAKRGHPLVVAGYYDGSQDTRKWLETMKKTPTTRGIMYTTWEHKFGELENFMKTVEEFYK